MKKILALILAALLIFCMVACSNSEQEETDDDDVAAKENAVTVESGKFVYDVNAEGDYEIVDYIPSSVKVIDLLELPKTTDDGRDISGIANDAFKAELSIKGVNIPDTYTYIGDYAFYDCDNLEKVTMADSVTSIGEYCFASCDKLFNPTISKSITKVSEGTFKDCVAITALSFSDATVEICDSAFFGCKSLALITVSNRIEKVTKTAFYGCDSLGYTVEGNAKYIGNPDNPHLVLVSIDDLNAETCTVNENTAIIADAAFANCEYLETLTLGASVRYLTDTAIENCPSLTYNEFDNARYLGTEENPYMVLVSVINLSYEDLKLHSDTAIITAEAFANCINLEDISYDKTTQDWNSIIKAENWNHDMTINVLCLGDAAEEAPEGTPEEN